MCPAVSAGLKLPSFPEHSVRVQYATEHRCGVVLAGPGLSDSITGTDPLRDNLPLQVDLGVAALLVVGITGLTGHQVCGLSDIQRKLELVQEAKALDATPEAAHTAAVVAELSAEMQTILRVRMHDPLRLV